MNSDLTRRQLIQRSMALAGYTTIAGTGTLLAACTSRGSVSGNLAPGTLPLFSAEQIAWLDDIADTILPATTTPGARAAQVGPFIALMVTDTYSPDEQRQFMAGMDQLEAECKAETGTGFSAATPAQRLQLLTRIDKEATASDEQQEGQNNPPHYFRMLKELTMLGYFTSEIGCKQAMRYVQTPGRYDPCADYTPGETIWSNPAW